MIYAMPATIEAEKPLKIAELVDILQIGSCSICRYSAFPSFIQLVLLSVLFWLEYFSYK